ncbi:MAG: dipeptidase [Planctomycetota bacterium]|nr:MAG: dipeptidase [Planctomycetota bacterium]
MSDLNAIDRYLQQTQPSQLELLNRLLRIPSISADPAYSGSVREAADTLVEIFRELGLQAELIETDGPPLVYAETPAVPGRPVVLVYGHYDVQPPDPLELWETPPFEPTIRDGKIYARGATDDKGQMLTHVLSVSAWLATGQSLPVQIKFLIEGEEEVGSEQLEAYLQRPEAADKLACDVVVISDSTQYGPDQPAITYGLRGIAYFEIHCFGPNQDLHSGSFGGAVANPATQLCRLLSQMIDDSGRIQIPGFYDAVRPLEESERQNWARLEFDDAEFAAQIGVEELFGEAGYTTLERRWARPTFDIHGLWGGYAGEGGKTIITARAGAKFSFRLVPDQTPEQVAEQVRAFVDSHRPPGVRLELIDLHGGPGVVVDPNSPFIAAAQEAITAAFGKPAVLIREGGSIPIVASFVQRLGADVLLLGWGQDDDGAHSPNEKLNLEDFYRGTRASSRLWDTLARVASSA